MNSNFPEIIYRELPNEVSMSVTRERLDRDDLDYSDQVEYMRHDLIPRFRPIDDQAKNGDPYILAWCFNWPEENGIQEVLVGYFNNGWREWYSHKRISLPDLYLHPVILPEAPEGES